MNYRKFFLSRPFIISLLVVILAAGAWYGTLTFMQNRAEHDAFIGDIENLYYYLKNEPNNIQKFSVLRSGDSVAISAWHNYLSTSNSILRNHERMIVEHLADYPHYKEVVLIGKLREGLELFKEIRTENLERVEGRPEYSLEEFEQLREKLTAILQEVVIMAKELNLTLR